MDELRIKVEQLIDDLENEMVNRNMNDIEEGRYKTLCESIIFDWQADMKRRYFNGRCI